MSDEPEIPETAPPDWKPPSFGDWKKLMRADRDHRLEGKAQRERADRSEQERAVALEKLAALEAAPDVAKRARVFEILAHVGTTDPELAAEILLESGELRDGRLFIADEEVTIQSARELFPAALLPASGTGGGGSKRPAPARSVAPERPSIPGHPEIHVSGSPGSFSVHIDRSKAQ